MKTKYYLTNKEFLKELNMYYDKGRSISKRLHEIFYLLSERVIRKPEFQYKIFNQSVKINDLDELYTDVIHEAYLKCCDKVESFNIRDCNNPFAFFTSVITNCYKDWFHLQYRQEVIKMIEQNKLNRKYLMEYNIKIQHIKELE